VTKASGIWVTFVTLLVLYVALGAALIIVLRSMSKRWRTAGGQDDGVPYGPDSGLPPDLATGSLG
jgi:cytochrome d ubiquinol oxidase subunit I